MTSADLGFEVEADPRSPGNDERSLAITNALQVVVPAGQSFVQPSKSGKVKVRVIQEKKK